MTSDPSNICQTYVAAWGITKQHTMEFCGRIRIAVESRKELRFRSNGGLICQQTERKSYLKH